MAGPTRGGNGRFARTLETAQKDAEAVALRSKGWTFQRIADELGLADKASAYHAVQRAFADVPYEAVDEARRLDLERIDRLIDQAWAVMEREHVAYSNGQVVRQRTGDVERDDDGFERLDDKGKTIPVYEPVMDDGPVLQAIDRIRSLLERRAKIIGYDAPVRSRVEVITHDMVEDAIVQLEAELAERAGYPGTA